MAICIYNSLTKKKEELNTLKKGIINMYTCGVTVYDKCHLGHARSLYVFDTIRKYLKYRGFTVNFIRNITDVDDKIINRANELNKNWKDVVEENIAQYRRDFRKLDIDIKNSEPRATDNIPDMIKHIQGLIDKGYAYESDGDIYFIVRRFKDYGKLSGQSIEEMLEAVRIEKDEKKKDPLDFALWKKSKEGEPFWDSPWGKGRPGWHIECSAMSLKYLNCETLDIHAGGRDLIFPHHENEIAQAEALTDKSFAKYWIHHGLITINAQKMAKSLGNFITLEDALNKYRIDDLKLFFLSSHYASPIDFSDKKIEETHKAWERLDIFFNEANQLDKGDVDDSSKAFSFIKEYKEKFITAMDDDFNTPRALGCLFELINETYKSRDQKKYPIIINMASNVVLEFAREIFGLFKPDVGADKTIEELLCKRKEAREKKDYKRSDEIREQLKEKGIIVEDKKEGQVWRKA